MTLNAFIIIFWLWGVVGVVGPVMTLVVAPSERAIRLISMLTEDPLGYIKNPRTIKGSWRRRTT